MNLYVITFREKGAKLYHSVLILANDEKELEEKITTLCKDELHDIDKRTIRWAGGSGPLMRYSSNPFIIYGVDLGNYM